MPCYHPFIRITDIGLTKGFKGGRFVPLSYESFLREQYRMTDQDYQKIPCGQCIGCRLSYSRQWATRCVLEAMEYPEDYNYALTLTYDPLLVPRPVKCTKLDTGEVFEKFPLEPKDLQDFMKSIRYYFAEHFNHQGIRFFACGEYGDKNERPHFHVYFR